MSESKEEIGKFGVDVIKELANQLKDLYGFASDEMMPVILKSISIHYTFSVISTIMAFIFLGIYLKFVIWKLTIPWMKEETGASVIGDEARTACGWLFIIISSIIIFFTSMCCIDKICYIFYPETKLVYSLLINKI